jgi:hypothetical protein
MTFKKMEKVTRYISKNSKMNIDTSPWPLTIKKEEVAYDIFT